MIRKKVKQVADANCLVIKPYTMGELASMYDVNRRTFSEWLVPFRKELGKRIGRYYSIRQVKLIFKKLDYPTMVRIVSEAN